MKTLTLIFHALPDLDAVGGNARPGHYMEGHKRFQAEKAKWITLIREELGPPPMPKFERAYMLVHLYFPVDRRRDQDNCVKALKPFGDALVHWGIIPDDDSKHLTTTLFICPALSREPLMQVWLTERGEGKAEP